MPAMTYASTFYATVNAGLKPVLVDINQNNPLINLNDKKKITNRTKVILLCTFMVLLWIYLN